MRRNASKLTYVPRALYDACDQLQRESLLHQQQLQYVARGPPKILVTVLLMLGSSDPWRNPRKLRRRPSRLGLAVAKAFVPTFLPNFRTPAHRQTTSRPNCGEAIPHIAGNINYYASPRLQPPPPVCPTFITSEAVLTSKTGQHIVDCAQETFPTGVTGIHADVRILAATETHIQFNRSAEMRCTLVPVVGQVTSSTWLTEVRTSSSLETAGLTESWFNSKHG